MGTWHRGGGRGVGEDSGVGERMRCSDGGVAVGKGRDVGRTWCRDGR